MTLKNNNLQKFEKAADRRQHFGIRKLTVGAASVLLGTTLWLGKDANVVRADTTNSSSTDGDVNASESTDVETPKIDANTQVQVNANNSEVKNVVDDSAENNVDKNVVSTDNQTKEVKKVVTGNEKASVPTVDQNNLTSANKAQKAENKKQTSATPTAQETLQAQAKKVQDKVQGDSIANAAEKAATTAEQKLSSVQNSGLKGSKATVKAELNKVDFDKVSESVQKATENNLSAKQVLANDAVKIQEAKGNTADEKVDNRKSGAEARRLAALYGMQLFARDTNTLNINADKIADSVIPESQLSASLFNAKDIGKDILGGLANAAAQLAKDKADQEKAKGVTPDKNGEVTATSWDQLSSALVNSNVKQVNFSGSITATDSADVNHDIIVNGAKGSSINFGTNTLNLSNGGTKLTLANLTINSENAGGAVVSNDDDNEITFKDVTNKKNSLFNGKGNVHIQGTVNTSVASDSSTGDLDLQGFADAAHTASGAGAGGAANPGVNSVYTLSGTNSAITGNWKQRKVPNIYASNLDIDANATLNINRTAAGDGIVLRDGAVTDGKNQITQKTDNGNLHVGKNATLNVNLNHSEISGEDIKDITHGIDTTNAAVRVNTNGTLTSDANAHINLRVGAGRGIVFGSRSDSMNTNNNANYISRGDPGMSGLDDRGNTVMTDWINRNPAIQSSVIFGENNTVTFVGRDAFMLGNRATFSSGKGSTVDVHTYGLGNAIDMGQMSKLQIDPSSTVSFISDGKTGPGNYNQNNYIALGGGGDIEVLKDATLRVILTNRGGADLNDDINIASYDPSLSPRIYVGNNATLDVQSDATQGNAELIAVPLPASKSVDFILDNVKYLNLQRTAKNSATILAPGMKSEMVQALARKHKGSTGSYGNLIFLNAGKGENAHFTAFGDLAAFKWDNTNLSSNGLQYDPNQTVSQNFGRFESSANQTWKNMFGFDIPYAGFTKAAANKDGVWVDPSGTTNGTNVNSEKGVTFSDVVDGFSPYMSQRLVVIGHSIQPVENQRTVHYVVQDVDEDGNVLETDPTQMREIAHAYVQNAQGNNAKEQLLYKDNATDQLVAVERNEDGTPKVDEHGAVIPVRDADGNYVTDGKSVNNWKGTDIVASNGRTHFKSYDAPETVTGTDGNKKIVKSLDGGVYVLATDDELATITSNADHVVKGGKVADSKDFANDQSEFKNGNFYNTYRDGNLYVVYRAIPQKANLNVVDDTDNGKTLTTITAGGIDNTDIKFDNGKKTVDDYLANGYKLVSVHDDNHDTDLTNTSYDDANFGKYDKDPSVDQSFTVHLVHKVVPITPDTPSKNVPKGTPENAQPDKLTKNVTLTVKYENNDGTNFTGTRPKDADQTLKFQGTAYVDETNGKLVNAKKDTTGNYIVDSTNKNTPEIVWTPKTGDFKAVTSPSETGYHVSDVSAHADASGKNVKAITGINKDDNNIEVVVSYDPDKAPEKDQAKLIYIDDDNNGSIIHPASSTEGDKDNPITFNGSADVVEALKKQGYIYQEVSGDGVTSNPEFNKVAFPKFDGDKGTQTFTVHFKHGQTPVDPQHPRDGIDPSQYTETHTQTINYVIGGDEDNKPSAPKSDTQSSNWQKTITVDTVTNKVVPNGKYDKDWSLSDPDKNYNEVKNPVVQGYHTDSPSVKANPKERKDTDITVVYKPNGKIIPVDKQGNPITGADHPQFPTDPSDPTKTTNQKLPNVPTGWTPEDPSLKPGSTPINPDKNDPSKDVLVPFVKKANIAVNYVDRDENNKVLHHDDLNGDIGDNIVDAKKNPYETGQEINDLVSKGYVLVSDGYNAGKKFSDDNNGQTYTVVFRHRIQPITPDTPPTDVPDGTPDEAQPKNLQHDVNLNVTYVNNDKTDFKGQIPGNAKQKVSFTGTAYVDATTGKLVNVYSESGTLVVDQGNNNAPSISWRPDTPQSFNPVISPIESGYHLISISQNKDGNNVGAVSGITRDTKDINITVTYAPNGRIIPVYQNGSSIPDDKITGNDKHPQYPTSPTDPSTVTPDEPVPVVPGYTPIVSTVTPNDPGKDTRVIYKKNTPEENEQRAIIQYIDEDNKNAILSQDVEKGKSGKVIDYSTKTKIAEYEDKGFVLDKDNFTLKDGQQQYYDSDVEFDQIFKVYLKHGTTPVNPKTPGKPGEPINPNDPEGPKYPEGSDQVTKDVKRTIKYVGAPGVHDPITQTAHFEGNGVLDKVTGQWKTPITWTGDGKLAGETTKAISGYHVTRVDRDSNDNINVDATTVNHETPDYTVTVTYAPNGHIIPVDPSGNPIPGADQPQYPTDPTDPSNVTPNEPIPNVSGYEPQNPNPVTPQDPGKDTPVVYVPKTNTQQRAVIKYVDQDNSMSTLHQDIQTGSSNTPIGYSTKKEIGILENQGYELVSDDYPQNATFDNNADRDQEFTVVLKHGHQPVNPKTPGKPKQPINPGYPEGPKYPQDSDKVTKDVIRTIHYVGAGDKTPKDVEQKAHFEGNGVLDKVTGAWVTPITWSDAQTLNGVPTTVVDGYHVVRVDRDSKDDVNVDSTTVDHNKDSYQVTVTYAPNGKLVPVDPSGKPIPGGKTPQYPTDPKNPSGVTPNEPIPDVPGYKPQNPNPVTPQDPGKDTPVVYNKLQNAQVVYRDLDDNNKTLDTDKGFSGIAGDPIKDDQAAGKITNFENQGYVLANNALDSNPVFDNIDDNTQTYYIDFHHGKQPIGPKTPGKPGEPINPNDPEGPKYPQDSDKVTKDVTRHIVYKGAGDKTPKQVDQKVSFTGTGTIDKVTGKWILADGTQTDDISKALTWSDDKDVPAVSTKFINGYHVVGVDKDSTDGINVDGKTLTHNDSDDTVTVTYEPNGKIIPVDPSGNPIPNAPTPQYPSDPDNPKGVTPNEGVPDVPGYTPDVPTVTPNDPGKDTNVVYRPVTNPEAKDQNAEVIFRDVDPNAAKEQLATSGNISGKSGSLVQYDPQTEIDTLIKQGYVLKNNGFPQGTVFDNDDKTTQKFYIDFVHGTTTVTPNKPGKPGEPIDPKNPEGPKYPDGTDIKNLKKTGTQTVHYSGAGDKTPGEKKQEFEFTKNITFDNVTGKIIDNGTWNTTSHTFGNEDTPVVDGYHADKKVAGGKTVTPENLHQDDYVKYTPNGHIIPVDPEGNPIPGADHPTFPTDPSDPTKPNTGVVPSVPNGWTPDDKKPGDKINPNPGDPTKDVTVPFHKTETPTPTTEKGSITVKVYDRTDKKTLDEYGKSDSNKDVGTAFSYDKDKVITELINKGYDVINPEITIPTEITKGDHDYTIYVEHTTTTVTPDKPGKPGEPVDPKNPNGPKYPDGTDENAVKRTATQTVKYTGAGDKTPGDKTQEFDFTRTIVFDNVTGKIKSTTPWNVTEHTFGNEDTPVVEGYHADKRTAGGQKVTPDDLKKVVTVTYTPNGHIIPIDPEGNPIPDAPTPEYPTDPKDPTKVVPDEKVPDITGRIPSQPTVTPQDPGKDTKVVYTTPGKDDVTGKISYIDDTTKETLKNDPLNGKIGEKITYTTAGTIADYENKGYKVVSNNFRDGQESFAKDGNEFEVHLIHDTTPVNPSNPGKPGEPINPNDPNGPKWPEGTDKDSLKKPGKQTIHYVGVDGKNPADNVQTTEFDHEVVIDKVTGKVTKDNGWTPDNHEFGKVDTPVVEGYHADKKTAGGKTVTVDNPEVEEIVTYTPNGHIIPVDPNGNPIPNVPTPQYPTDPSDPTKVTSNEPVPTVPGKTPEVPTVTPQDPGKDTKVVYTTPTKDEGVVNVRVIDKTTGQPIPSYNWTTGTHEVGTKVNYDRNKTVTDLTNKGYDVLNPDVEIPSEITKGTQTVTIYAVHGTTTVDPKHPGKPGEPINPNDPEGPKWPDRAGENNLIKNSTQTITIHYADGSQPDKKVTKTDKGTFTRKVTVDKVTGQVTEETPWTGSHTFETENVPVVEGYHSDKKTVGGKTATPETPNVTDEVTYTPNGKIVPVDPSGKPIPDAPTPQYKTDPNDPTRVTPDEDVPEVPGNTPSQTTVTPKDPSKDTTVVYNNQGGLTIVVHDKTTDTDLTNYGYNSGKVNGDTKVTWNHDEVVKDLKDHGYKIVTDITVPSTVGGKTQTLTMVVEHETTPVGPKNPHTPGEPINPNDPNGPKWPAEDNYTKSYTSTVHFVDENGKSVGKDDVQTSTWTRTLIVDKVTGEVVNPNETWTSDKDNYDETKVPVVDGYVADTKSKNGETVGKTIAGQKVVQDNIEDSVVYHKIGKIVPVDPSGNPIPGADTPIYVNDPDDPSKVVPNENVPDVPGYIPVQTTVTPQDPTKDTEVVYTKNTTPVVPNTPDTPTPAPTTPQPTTPAQPTQASQASQASQPTEPSEPDVPDDDEPTTPTTHHKSHKNNPAPVGPAKRNNNNAPRPTAPTPAPYNNNVAPHAQNGYYNSVAPHAGSNVAPDGQVLPAGDTIGPKGTILNSKGEVVGYIDKNGHPHFTLPQTGENNSENTAAVVAGSLAMGLGMIGLAGVKRRKRD